MKEVEFKAWMEAKGHLKKTASSRAADLRRIETVYGDLDNLPEGQTLAAIRQSLQYSKADERADRSNPSRFAINGNLYDSLANLRKTLNLYERFLDTEALPHDAGTLGLTAQDILLAIERCDAAGSVRDFIASHEGLGNPMKFWLLHQGRRYPSKAIVRSALGHIGSDALPGGGPCKMALDALGFVVIDWRAFEKARETFFSRMTGFQDFRRKDGGYWMTGRRSKDEVIQDVQTIAASAMDDRAAGEKIVLALSADIQGLPWQRRILDEIEMAEAELRDRFYEAVARMARSEDDPFVTITGGTRVLEQLQGDGIVGLHRDDVLAIAIGTVGTVHPEAACWFEISHIEAMGQRLFGRKLFVHNKVMPTDLDEFLQIMRELFALFGGELKWNPVDLFDVQGFIWAALDEKLAGDEEVPVFETPLRDPMKRSPLNLILYGPPGTGKTYRTMAEAVRLCRGLADSDPLLHASVRRQDLRKAYEELKDQGQIGFVTFHQNYAYEDFVEGLRPHPLTDGIGFTLKAKAGVLRQMAEAAEASAEEHVLIIDEINRANISKVFGELITLIEPDKRIGMDEGMRLTLPYSNARFGVPANLHIIGTMNTADRSIALLDTALRRRFEFRELMPDVSLLGTVDGIDLAALLATINERIEYLFDREHQIGHAYFIHCETRHDVDEVMRYKVIPLLAEYFYEDWEKVAAVLGDCDGREGDSGHGFMERRRLMAPKGLGGGEDSGPRYRWSVRDSFFYDGFAPQ